MFFGVYPLQREDGVIISLPLFELILMRLAEGGQESLELAGRLAQATTIEILPPTKPAI